MQHGTGLREHQRKDEEYAEAGDIPAVGQELGLCHTSQYSPLWPARAGPHESGRDAVLMFRTPSAAP